MVLLNWELPFKCLLPIHGLISVTPEVGNSLQLLTWEQGRGEITGRWL